MLVKLNCNLCASFVIAEICNKKQNFLIGLLVAWGVVLYSSLCDVFQLGVFSISSLQAIGEFIDSKLLQSSEN